MKRADELAFMICEVVYVKLSYKIWVRKGKSAWKQKKNPPQFPEKNTNQNQGDICI